MAQLINQQPNMAPVNDPSNDPYSAISNFVNSGFESFTQPTAIGPLTITPEPIISTVVAANTPARVLTPTDFIVDLPGERNDLHLWSLTSRDGKITFCSDTHVTEREGVFTLTHPTPCLIESALYRAPGEQRDIGFYRAPAVCPAGTTISLEDNSDPLSIAA